MKTKKGDELLTQSLYNSVIQHNNQYRKDRRGDVALPYVVHPIEVMKKVWDWGVSDVVTLMAAVSHDFEDCVASERPDFISLVRQQVLQIDNGELVQQAADIVEELTLTPIANKAEYLESFAKKSVQALVIKVADRLCNSMNFFNGGDHAYAWKYLRKADTVIQAMKNREGEIILFFGEDVYQNMKSDVWKVERFLRPIPEPESKT